MPPLLALILTSIFVVWLLKLEHKGAPQHSRALWLPVTLTMLLSSRSLADWFPTLSNATAMESPLDRNFLLLLIFAGILVLIYRKFNFLLVIKENKFLLFIVAYMLISVLWSDMVFISFKRWTREILTPLIMSFIILSEKDPHEAFLSVIRRTTYILIPFSLILIKYYGHLGVEYGRDGELMWIGVATQKNGNGLLCLISIFFLFWSIMKRRRENKVSAVKYQTAAEWFLLILAGFLLKGPSIRAMSATSVAVLFAALVILVLLLIGNKFKIFPSANLLMAMMSAVIIIGTVAVFTAAQSFGTLASILGRDATLTGRTELWAEFLPMAMQRPRLGYGFGGFWTEATIALQEVNEAHNGYLEALLNFGFPGLILLALFLISSCQKAQQILREDFYWASLWIGFLFMSAFHNISESTIESFSNNMTLMLLFMYVCSSSYNPLLLRKVNYV